MKYSSTLDLEVEKLMDKNPGWSQKTKIDGLNYLIYVKEYKNIKEIVFRRLLNEDN